MTASVVAVEPTFCMLRTRSGHSRCKSVSHIHGDINPSAAITFPPASPFHFHTIPCFINLESVAAYHNETNDLIRGTEYYMEVICHYGEKCRNGLHRLLYAPFFSLTGDFMGVFVGVCRPREPLTDGVATSHVFKLALSRNYIGNILGPLMAQLDGGRIEEIPDHKRPDASETAAYKFECSSKNASKRKRGEGEGGSESKRFYSIKRSGGGGSPKKKPVHRVGSRRGKNAS